MSHIHHHQVACWLWNRFWNVIKLMWWWGLSWTTSRGVVSSIKRITKASPPKQCTKLKKITKFDQIHYIHFDTFLIYVYKYMYIIFKQPQFGPHLGGWSLRFQQNGSPSQALGGFRASFIITWGPHIHMGTRVYVEIIWPLIEISCFSILNWYAQCAEIYDG